ncbi:hypothetical protein COMA1_10723 [Candidatus Nitrospira nitrosa]|uniref:Uncharacterized protein n=1 Tax=Candidatus Nitrospira nitrosa TaxID=1742972 RepID=A0A0S4L7M3_9BACT|nr:hypothetical protein COMA1_10723 [Candidatus Nitrospira nitrosa]
MRRSAVGDGLKVPVLRIDTLQNDTDGKGRLGVGIFLKNTCMRMQRMY